MTRDPLLLLGCGILRKEVHYLIEKNGWPVETLLMASALHSELDKLERGLTGALAKHAEDKTVVFYGCCHPHMDTILEQAHTLRTEGQNCVEMLLGKEHFTQELLAGAFFLLEDWALKWERITKVTFGEHPAVIREIFQVDRKYMLGLITPCSGDFRAEAEAAAAKVGLPLRWEHVGLEHLETVLRQAIERRLAQSP